jgi:hypothetical protein
VLEQYGIAPERIQREAEIVRRAGYEVLRAETWPTDTSEPLAEVEPSESLNETPVSDSPRP